MAEQGNRQHSIRMIITVVLLVLLALGFFAASFFALP
jgi:flagellar basal body-associated protein FliL